MNGFFGTPRRSGPAHWADLPALLPITLLQAAPLGFICGVVVGGLPAWLIWDAFWIGTGVVAVPVALVLVGVLLRTGLVDEEPEEFPPDL